VCTAFQVFNAGNLGSTPLIYHVSVHGPKFATATIGGKPYALSTKRSTFGRDGLNLAALKDMTEGRASTTSRFYKTANQFGFTFNWAYVSRKKTAFFSSGYLPKRPKGLDRRLLTNGDGQHEWVGFLSTKKHPHDVRGPGGLLLNWNNRSAPGFMHGDDEPYGSVQRVELFDKYPVAVTLTDDVGIMNRAASEDVRSPVWPIVRRVLQNGTAPNARDQVVVDILDDWVDRDAPRLDANTDTYYDEPGPVIMDALWRPIADAVMSPVVGSLIPDLDNVRNLDGLEGESYVDKDLRTLLGDPVVGPFNVSYCGDGAMAACAASLWQAIHDTAETLTTQQSQADPHLWKKLASTTGFVPGLLPNRFLTTNRPTFQQFLEFDRVAPSGVRFYGTDLGWTFEHRGTHYMLFGDTWPHDRSMCEPLPHNDDSQATLPLGLSAGLPALPIATDPDAPAEFARIRLFTDGESQVMGYNKTPLTAFSDGTDAVVLFGLIDLVRCGTRRGRPSCRPYEHLTCRRDVGICTPDLLG
jgi:hypothetical protein